MSRLNGNGPEDKGSGTGRSLGNCSKNLPNKSTQYKLGQGMGRRRKSGVIEDRNL